jgi:GNAT superfamily N-acetyltransferase
MVGLKRLELRDIQQAIQLSMAENWNQTEKDWELLIRNPQNLCLAATDNEKLIGTATAINYENDLAWIGMVIVDKEYRGQKISKMLVSNLIENFKDCTSLKLDATPAGQPVYQKFGFNEECLIHRFTSTSVFINDLHPGRESSAERAGLKDIQEIIEYDKRIFGANRKQLIGFYLTNYPERAWMLRQNGKITGIAMGRKGNQFHHIGPVSASNSENAKKLISKSLVGLENQPVVVDILGNKKELINWFNTIGFKQERDFVRMYKNENSCSGLPENQFLISGPEFG